MRIVLIGMKGSGKTTVGTLLAATLQVTFIDSDTEIERIHQRERGEILPAGQILHRYGQTYFHAMESRALKHIASTFGKKDFVLSCGGRTPLQDENQEVLSRLGIILFLNVDADVLLKRIIAQGIPEFFPYQDDPERSLHEVLTQRTPTYKRLANLTIDIDEGTPEEVMHTILMALKAYEQH